ncbi:unnamed protein product [Vitrella brassicaformis CCMP3155]|uniref:Signal recognition particle receptor subunit beta n=1 Tax=Vitrella brassicaformis (strain CCMP3155) TaxID=1169540 RepID=A0A0G4FPN3_VITBC|nr:unnamed protein product [Vitrella brassicaformis CCMP3155]|eukprot:CEM16418.1 unnamed protein product [Vitrella brassicaformis CCMP3155]
MDVLSDTFTTLAAAVEAAGSQVGVPITAEISLAVVLLAVLCTLLVIVSLARSLRKGTRRLSRGDLLLIAGQCDAGKTALFHYLRSGDFPETVSSLKPNTDIINVLHKDEGDASSSGGGGVGGIEVCDYPGHQRLSHGFFGHLKRARCVVYVIDATDKAALKNVAEHLYEIFTHPATNKLRPPLLLACNKSDVPTARKPDMVKDDIEREIERLRQSRSATLEGQDEADNYLGVDGETFKLDMAPCRVDMCRMSVKKAEVQDVIKFLADNYR